MKTLRFTRRSRIPAPVDELESWHHRPGALERLLPPWEEVELVDAHEGVAPGARTRLRVRVGPFRLGWEAEHRALGEDGRGFRDVQLRGPFVRWEHRHSFEASREDESLLEDRIDYALPLGLAGRLVAGRSVRRRLERGFAYRHRVTAGDLAAHHLWRRRRAEAGRAHPLTLAVSGASGLVGSELVPFLRAGGHEVVRLVRREPREGAALREVRWDPRGGHVDAGGLEGVDAVVHLAGENVASRWTEEKKTAIRASRVRGTETLSRALAGLDEPPEALVTASGINYYGDRGDELLTEESGPGEGFLAEVCRGWEGATAPAAEAGIRVANLRFGMVLSPRDGALARMLPAFQLGLGGPMGSGRQYVSWIAMDDLLGVIHHALMNPDLSGPVNATAPHPVSNRRLARTLGRVLSRIAFLRVPAFALRALMGQMAEEMLLSSLRVVPAALQDSGYTFRYPRLEGALEHLLGTTTEGPAPEGRLHTEGEEGEGEGEGAAGP